MSKAGTFGDCVELFSWRWCWLMCAIPSCRQLHRPQRRAQHWHQWAICRGTDVQVGEGFLWFLPTMFHALLAFAHYVARGPQVRSIEDLQPADSPKVCESLCVQLEIGAPWSICPCQKSHGHMVGPSWSKSRRRLVLCHVPPWSVGSGWMKSLLLRLCLLVCQEYWFQALSFEQTDSEVSQHDLLDCERLIARSLKQGWVCTAVWSLWQSLQTAKS